MVRSICPPGREMSQNHPRTTVQPIRCCAFFLTSSCTGVRGRLVDIAGLGARHAMRVRDAVSIPEDATARSYGGVVVVRVARLAVNGMWDSCCFR